MTLFLTVIAIIQSFSVSLGVGSSTLAILNFFAAIADGTIDATERRMMGIVYVVLRVAMGLILVSSTLLLAYQYSTVGLANLAAFDYAFMLALLLLFVNAMLMTAHLMPSTFGPSIQAGSWYTLGTLMTLRSLDLTDFTFWQFFMGYLTWIVLAIAIVNGVMAVMNAKREAREAEEAEEA